MLFRKLEKAVAVSGVSSAVLEKSPRKIPRKLLENKSESQDAMRAETITYEIPKNIWQVMVQVIITWNPEK